MALCCSMHQGIPTILITRFRIGIVARSILITIGFDVNIRGVRPYSSVIEGSALASRSKVVKKEEDRFLVKENGYRKEDFMTDSGKIKKLLKTLLKREFPRSRKVRLYALGEYKPELLEKKWKVL